MSDVFRTTDKFECPFCGTQCDVVEGAEEQELGVIHGDPMCEQFTGAEDALDFVSRCRNEKQRQRGIS